MDYRRITIAFVLGIALLANVLAHPQSDQKGSEANEALFVRYVAPLLREKCQACHGADPASIEGSLNLLSLDGILKGGENDVPSMVPGKPEESPIYLAATRSHEAWSPMPPKEAEKLTEKQLDSLRSWIEGGAFWPSQDRIKEIAIRYEKEWSAEDGTTVATSGGLADDWTDRRYKLEGLWAYQPVRKPTLPDRSGQKPLQSPIDQLLQLRMPDGLAVAQPADRKTLARRASYDLTGLPPGEELIADYLSDSRSEEVAFASLVEKLLESPHYGERMAQHWLDVVRYADSSGFANDYERGNAWRYRDYVVRSFNSDKPYDQFVMEQIAGDELSPNDPESIIATGFLRMGPWELTGMEVAKVARQRFLDDVVNSVGETFLAHSLQCARCHDHKFDPIPTRDYYAIQAVFATTQLAERSVPFLPSENKDGFEEKRYLEQSRDDHMAVLAKLDILLIENAQAWFEKNGKDPTKWNEAIEKARSTPKSQGKGKREFSDIFSTARNDLLRQGISEDEFPPKLLGFTPEQFGAERVARKGLERLKWELERYEPYALAVYNGRTPELKSVYAPTRIPKDRMTEGELEQTCILTGGDPFASGEKVSPDVLSVMTGGKELSISAEIEGRRLGFAKWVASSDNSLTTRAIVNRIWMWHFGQPIAGNPNNFGSTGKRPTHPELLDWLAWSLVENRWSIKSLHRSIMLSEAYRRSATHHDRERLATKDPLASSYAVFQPRRLSAEEIRDSMLFATGELNLKVGGIPNRPEMNLEAAMQPRQVMGTFAAAWVPNPSPKERHRRSLYALKLRGLSDPMQEVFNAPAPDFSCERRDASTVTPQVFSLFNSQSSHSRALALAHRAIGQSKSDKEAIEKCFQWTLLRSPKPNELTWCIKHWVTAASKLQTTDNKKMMAPLEVLREAVEENTGERFTFVEKLYAYRDFVPDLQPSDVDHKTQALADVCLAILNSNEFVYVY